jgi:hypothetical protein
MKQAIRGTSIVLAVLALLMLAIPGKAQSRCPGGSVSINPSSAWQRIIDTQLSAVNYCLVDGVYNFGNIALKDGDGVYASNLHGVIFDGQLQTKSLFVSTFSPQSSGNIENVTLDGIVVRNYRSDNAWNASAIEGGVGWQIRYVIVHSNTSGLLYSKGNWDCANGVVLEHSTFYDNTHLAMQWNGTNGTFRHLNFRNNGWGATAEQAGWYGSIKITNNPVWANGNFNSTSNCPQSVSFSVNTSYITSVFNRAAGWWQDENIRQFTFQQNYIAYNERWGVFQEIGYGGTISNNTFECNGSRQAGNDMWSRADIFVANSQGVTIENNVIRVCPAGYGSTINGVAYTTQYLGRGVVLVDETYRYNAYAYDLPRQLRNVTVRNNTFIQLGTIDAMSWYEWDSTTPTGITFTNNTYYVSSTGQLIYRNDWQFVNFSTWQGTHGRDTGSTQVTSAAPTGAPTLTPTASGGTAVPTNTPTPTPTSAPTSGGYFGSALTIASTGVTRVQAENFDWGANGAAYNDFTVGDDGYSGYRGGDADIKIRGTGEYAIAWFETGEWLNYSINVAASGYYQIVVYGIAVDAGRYLDISTGGTLRARVLMPTTPSWDGAVYATATVANVYLPAGAVNMRIQANPGYLDVDWIEFTRTVGVTSTPTATQTPSITPTASVTFTPSPTFTPSTTPSPLPSLTPTATLNIPAILSTALEGVNRASDVVATANAGVATQASANATGRAALATRVATQSAANATLSAADSTLTAAEATANAP